MDLLELLHSKIVTTVVSTFTAQYTYLWPLYFKSTPLSSPLPSFDGRAVLYPNTEVLRDYLSWRQVDCHINNLYNTTFWTMVQKGGKSPTSVELELKETLAADKNEILFSRYGMNYNNEAEIFRKGSVVYRQLRSDLGQSKHASTNSTTTPGFVLSSAQRHKETKKKSGSKISLEHIDLIKDAFWIDRPWLP